MKFYIKFSISFILREKSFLFLQKPTYYIV